MIVYGIHAVGEALEKHPERVRRLLVMRGRRPLRLRRLVDMARGKGVAVHLEPAAAMERKAGSDKHQGVLAEMAAVPLYSLDQLLETQPRFLLLADGVEDPRNLGALVRTADGAGVEALLLPARRSCGLTPVVAKTSAGALHHLRVVRVGNVTQTLKRLQKEGFTVVGLDLGGREEVPPGLEPPVVVVVGGESRGLRRLVADTCDWRVRLPMHGRVDSLNLSVAAGVLLYQLDARGVFTGSDRSAPGSGSAIHQHTPQSRPE